MKFKRYASDDDDSWSKPVPVFVNNTPPTGEPSVAVRTVPAVSPEQKADLDRVIKIGTLDKDEQQTLRSIMETQTVPHLTVDTSGGNNGWVDGEVAQPGSMSQPHDEEKTTFVNLRVFDANLPPEGGFMGLPGHVRNARAARDNRVAQIQADIQASIFPGTPPVHVVAPKGRSAVMMGGYKQPQLDLEGLHDDEEYDRPVLDDAGRVLLVDNEMVAALVGSEESEEKFPYAIGRFLGVKGHMEELPEEDQKRDDAVDTAEEGDSVDGSEPQVWIQWFGNKHDTERMSYNSDSEFLPGWEDLGDKKHPLLFCKKVPTTKTSNVKGPVVKYLQTVSIDAIALHGFVLTPRNKLPRPVADALDDLALPQSDHKKPRKHH